jgi:hypothetical protein
MWNVQIKVISVIIGATGTISRSFTQYLSNIPGKHKIEELQKNYSKKKKPHWTLHIYFGKY